MIIFYSNIPKWSTTRAFGPNTLYNNVWTLNFDQEDERLCGHRLCHWDLSVKSGLLWKHLADFHVLVANVRNTIARDHQIRGSVLWQNEVEIRSFINGKMFHLRTTSKLMQHRQLIHFQNGFQQQLWISTIGAVVNYLVTFLAFAHTSRTRKWTSEHFNWVYLWLNYSIIFLAVAFQLSSWQFGTF